MKKEPDNIILHVTFNDAASKTLRIILDDFLKLKNIVINTLPNCKVIISKPNMCLDNGKAAITIENIDIYFHQLE